MGGGGREGGVEGEAELSAGHGGGGREDEEGGVGLLEGALQAIPRARGYAAEFAEGGAAKIKQDELEIRVASEEISDGHGIIDVAAAEPHEAAQVVGQPGAGIEAIGTINECDAPAVGTHDVEELSKEKLAAAAGCGTDEFG